MGGTRWNEVTDDIGGRAADAFPNCELTLPMRMTASCYANLLLGHRYAQPPEMGAFPLFLQPGENCNQMNGGCDEWR